MASTVVLQDLKMKVTRMGNKQNIFSVYALIDPRCHTPFYVGRTGKDPSARLAEHVSELDFCHGSMKQKRMLDILEDGYKNIGLVVLESNISTEKESFCKEIYWIETFLKAGVKLTNASVDFKGIYFLREDTLEEDVDSTNSINTDKKPSFDDSEGVDIYNGSYFRMENHVSKKIGWRDFPLDNETMLRKRVKNRESGKLLNHGFPITDEEVTFALRFYENSKDMRKMVRFFQRAESSLRKLIEENLPN
jgi:hypothetical protein